MSIAAGRRKRPHAPFPSASHERRLTYAALIFAGSLILHNGDHLRRGWDAVTHDVLLTGTLGLLLSTTAIVLVLAHHRLAPAAATVVGFAMALGVALVHLLPSWGALSDSLPDGAVDSVTWIAVLAEIAGALLFGFAGLAALRRPGPR